MYTQLDMASPVCRVTRQKPTTKKRSSTPYISCLTWAFHSLPISRIVNGPSLSFGPFHSPSSRAAPLIASCSPQDVPTTTKQPKHMEDTDLEITAQRVRQLEAEAIAMHDLAQRLNKEARYEGRRAERAHPYRSYKNHNPIDPSLMAAVPLSSFSHRTCSFLSAGRSALNSNGDPLWLRASRMPRRPYHRSPFPGLNPTEEGFSPPTHPSFASALSRG